MKQCIFSPVAGKTNLQSSFFGRAQSNVLLHVQLKLQPPSTDPKIFLYSLALSCEVTANTHTQAWGTVFQLEDFKRFHKGQNEKAFGCSLDKTFLFPFCRKCWCFEDNQPTTLTEKQHKTSLSLSLPMLWPCHSNQPELAGKLSILGKIVAPFYHPSSKAIHEHIVLLEQFWLRFHFWAINADRMEKGTWEE